MNKLQKVTLGAIIGILLFNPLSVAVLKGFFDLAYTVLFVGASVWVMGYLLKTVLTPETVNLPKDNPTQDYIPTSSNLEVF